MNETLRVIDAHKRPDLIPGHEYEFSVQRTIHSPCTGNILYVGSFNDDKRQIVAKFSVFKEGSNREWNGYTTAILQDVSTAIPVALVSKKSHAKKGVLTEFIDGPLLDSTPTDFLLYRFGRELGKLHTIIVPGYGYFKNFLPQFRSAQEYQIFWLGKILPYIEKSADTYPLFKNLHDNASLTIYTDQPVFLHKDARLDNAIADHDGVRLLDFESWQGGDPMDDLAISLFSWITSDINISQFRHVIDGYFSDKNITDHQRTLVNYYLLFRAFRLIKLAEDDNSAKLQERYQNLNKIVSFITSEQIYKIR